MLTCWNHGGIKPGTDQNDEANEQLRTVAALSVSSYRTSTTTASVWLGGEIRPHKTGFHAWY